MPGIPTLTAEAGDAEVTLKWTTPNAGTSAIDGYDYRVGVSAMTWNPDWTPIPDSGAGGANASSYPVTMYAGSVLVKQHHLHLRGARAERGGGRPGGASHDNAGRGVRADESDSEHDCVGRAGQRLRRRDDGAPCVNHGARHDKQRTFPTLKNGDFAGLSA